MGNDEGKIKTQELKDKIKELNPYGNVDMLLKVIDDVDLDNNGAIDYEEFLRALHPDFQETPNWFWSKMKGDDDAEDQDDDGDDLSALEPQPDDQKENFQSQRS